MAKAISQSDTKWYKKGEKLPSGDVAKKGQLVQISTGKTYTGKVKIESIGSTAYNSRGIAEYKGGKNTAMGKAKPSGPSAPAAGRKRPTAAQSAAPAKKPTAKPGKKPAAQGPAASTPVGPKYVSGGAAAAKAKWSAIQQAATKRGAGAGKAYEERKPVSRPGQRPKRPLWEPELGQSVLKKAGRPLVSVAERKKMREETARKTAVEKASRARSIARLKAMRDKKK